MLYESSFQIKKGLAKNENSKDIVARKKTVSFGNNSSILERYYGSWKNKFSTLEWTTKNYFFENFYQHLYKVLKQFRLNVMNYYEKSRKRCVNAFIAAISRIATLLEYIIIIFVHLLIIFSSKANFNSTLASFLHSDRRKITFFCFLLNKNNSTDHSYLFNILFHKYIFVKRKILQRFLVENFYYDVVSTFPTPTKKDPHFWYECAENLGDKTFVSHVEYYVARSFSQAVNVSALYPEECYGQYEIEDATFHRLRFSINPLGNIKHKSHDPPGQHSVYIPPGDTKLEIYRLSTFTKFPSDSPVVLLSVFSILVTKTE